MKKWLVGLLGVAALSLSAVTAVLADDELDEGMDWVYTEDYGRIPMFTDGRINAFDLAAPVVIYYTDETVTTPDGGSLLAPGGIELLAVEPVTNQGYLVLDADVAELEQLASGAVDSIGANGYSLHYSSGWFWVTAPADAEGKIYSFTWENTILPIG